MKNKFIIFIMVAGLMLTAKTVKAQHDEDQESKGSMMEHQDSMMQESDQSGLPEVGNKICPVSSEKVGQMGDVVKVEYNGKIYNLCCAMCKKDFLKDPEKLSKIAEDEMKENGEIEIPDQEEAGHDHSGDEHP